MVYVRSGAKNAQKYMCIKETQIAVNTGKKRTIINTRLGEEYVFTARDEFSEKCFMKV